MSLFYDYLKKPVCFEKYSMPDFFHFLNLFFVYLFLVIPLALTGYIICSVFGIIHEPIDMTFIDKFFAVFLIAPIYEEIFFRSLLRFNWFNISLFITNLLVFILYMIIKENIMYVTIASVFLFFILAIITIASIKKTSNFISQNIQYFFYFTAISFGLLHTINFSGNPWAIFSFSLILVSPQIILGLILGYVRIKYGLLYSILFHMVVNASVLLS